jgi:anhydro-N-acetylmuramic acid kinase
MPLYIGLISGTSADAVDAALVEIDNRGPNLIASHSEPIPGDVGKALHEIITSTTLHRSTLWHLDSRMGELFARATTELLSKAGISASRICAIGSHGQTIFHEPDAEYPCTVQIGDPNVIAERTGITTVADLRRRDMAAGGQAAPLAPAFHQAVFRSPDRDRAVVNIGGIANLTLLPGESSAAVIGFDTGPGNTLLDEWIGSQRGEPMDTGARWADTGTCHPQLLSLLLEEPYFSLPPPKSTGRERFHLDWLQGNLVKLSEMPTPADVQRTLCELTSLTIAGAVHDHAADTGELLVCGGGAHNPLLLSRLAELLQPIQVRSTASAGIEPDWVEAMAFAWLAAQTLEGKPGNLPSVTGAAHPVVLGGIYPGSSGLRGP